MTLEWGQVPPDTKLVGAETSSLREVLPLLHSTEGRTRGASWKQLLIRDGPWEGVEKTVAWELYFQKEGYSHTPNVENQNVVR